MFTRIIVTDVDLVDMAICNQQSSLMGSSAASACISPCCRVSKLDELVSCDLPGANVRFIYEAGCC